MQDDIIEIYSQIIDKSKEIKAAILQGEWERVDVLASHREELFQRSGNYLSKNKLKNPELKEKVLTLLNEIKELDDANFKLIEEGKASMEKLRAKIKVGQKALKAYHALNKPDRTPMDQEI